MLEYLRKNASSFFSKALLGLIALIFALYFGFTGGGGPPQGGTAPIAKVNGESIPNGLFMEAVQGQVSVYQNLGQNSVPRDLQKVLEVQTLQRLINNTLFSQAARQLGLRVTDEELAEAIRENPAFQRNGMFDEEFYLKQFKPYYQRQNGQDYEFSLREQLLQERFRQVLEQANVVSEQQVRDTVAVENTMLNLLKVEIPIGKNPGERDKETAVKIAREWIAAKQNSQPAKKILEEHSLEEIETGEKSLQTLQTLFGGADSLPILLCILQTKPGEVCPDPIQVGEKIIAVQLLEGKNAQPDDTQSGEMRRQLAQANLTQVLTGVADLLKREAKIETFLEQK
jgi:parvulin-like peptidyl-prolyl isomerase